MLRNRIVNLPASALLFIGLVFGRARRPPTPKCWIGFSNLKPNLVLESHRTDWGICTSQPTLAAALKAAHLFENLMPKATCSGSGKLDLVHTSPALEFRQMAWETSTSRARPVASNWAPATPATVSSASMMRLVLSCGRDKSALPSRTAVLAFRLMGSGTCTSRAKPTAP